VRIVRLISCEYPIANPADVVEPRLRPGETGYRPLAGACREDKSAAFRLPRQRRRQWRQRDIVGAGRFHALGRNRDQRLFEVDVSPAEVGDLAQPLTGQDQQPDGVAPWVAELERGGPHRAQFAVLEHAVPRRLLAENVLLAQPDERRGGDVELARPDRKS
jgi:hypothetical protein